MRMIEFNDGYHTPTFVLNIGESCFKLSHKEGLSFLCGVHSPLAYKQISYECLEEREISAFEVLDDMKGSNDTNKPYFDLLWQSEEGEIIEG